MIIAFKTARTTAVATRIAKLGAPIDAERVRVLSAAIANGRYRPDAAQIAAAMIEQQL